MSAFRGKTDSEFRRGEVLERQAGGTTPGTPGSPRSAASPAAPAPGTGQTARPWQAGGQQLSPASPTPPSARPSSTSYGDDHRARHAAMQGTASATGLPESMSVPRRGRRGSAIADGIAAAKQTKRDPTEPRTNRGTGPGRKADQLHRGLLARHRPPPHRTTGVTTWVLRLSARPRSGMTVHSGGLARYGDAAGG